MDTETYLQVEMSDYYTKDPEYANATIPVYVIQKPRSDTENMVILFCAEGYTKSQQADFIQGCSAAVAGNAEYGAVPQHGGPLQCLCALHGVEGRL